jgi:hypothetical protein
VSKNPVQTATARLGAASRKDRGRDPEILADARNGLVAAKTERAIQEALKPKRPYEPLRADDRRRLAALLLDGLN